MLDRLSRFGAAYPRRQGLAAVLVFVVVAAIGAGAAGTFDVSHAFSDPGSDSSHVRDRLEDVTGKSAEAGIVALVEGAPGSARVRKVAAGLEADPGIGAVEQPAAEGHSPLVSANGDQVLVMATERAGVDAESLVSRLRETVADRPGVELGGNAVAQVEVNEQATDDLGTAELIAFPLLAIMMIILFRGVAALLPLAVGATAVVGTFAALRGVNEVVAISPFALNLVIGLGLGLAVDYSLLSVSRFREELGGGADPPQALRATLRQAGHTVLFSAITVAAALACLTVFPQRFLISMGIGGALVALIAAASAFLVLPPLLMLLAPRLGRVKPKPEGEGRWYRLSEWTMRRPLLVGLGSVALMLVLASPAAELRWTGVDVTSLPHGKSARNVFEKIDAGFPGVGAGPVVVAVEAGPDAKAQVDAYAAKLAGLGGVVKVPPPTYIGADTWKVAAETDAAPSSDQGQALVDAARATVTSFPALVGGVGAELKDSRAAVSAALPLALTLLVALTLVALWLMTGSVVLPVQALVMNFLTLAAATGVVVFVFQGGHLTGLVGADPQNGVEQNDFLVMAALIFGLSTDYGVFLLSRIKEERDSGRPGREAVAAGLQRSGTVVSAAAVLLAIAIGAFATSGLVFLKEIGIGAAFAVLLDAFVVRSLLVPSLMALFGERNWWAPRPLRSLHRRFASIFF